MKYVFDSRITSGLLLRRSLTTSRIAPGIQQKASVNDNVCNWVSDLSLFPPIFFDLTQGTFIGLAHIV